MASYPPTEACEVSNNSLFSDSMEFDEAQKPPKAPEEIAAELENEASEEEPEVEQAPPREPTPEPVQQGAAHLKHRKTAGKQATNWAPLQLAVPRDDPEDEFDISSAQKPIYEEEEAEGGKKKRRVTFQHGEPDMEGDVTNCFEEPGLLYRIVDKKNKTWAFYNDSLSFEVHVVCTFGKHSKLEALENTQIRRDANGDYIAEVTVYPCETELFVRGFVNGFTSKLRALPLSDTYYQQRAALQHESTIQQEIDAIREIVGDETDAEVILQVCLENNLPFVDLSFPPEQPSIDTGASKPFKQLPWARPSNYLKPEQADQVRLFRNGIVPGDVNQGELGDCWLMCALATHAEEADAVIKMFRHPKGPEYGRRERALGAYRVTFNKNGLWRSVLVDDYLPLIANTPKFAHSNDPCELWPAILEKAFAKLHRSYAMIQSGDPVHALTDMTGCPSMRFDDDFAEAQERGSANLELFQRWLAWDAAGYQLLLTTPGKAPAITPGSNNVPDFSEEPELEQQMAGTGLLPGHAYSVLAVRSIGDAHLVKVRNAWCYGAEWAGAWSRSSSLWTERPRGGGGVRLRRGGNDDAVDGLRGHPGALQRRRRALPRAPRLRLPSAPHLRRLPPECGD
ncbi:calpain-like cysteine peptidase [Strigomonas culicis]|uniref:Calpain-like cysteine peptidase n=1 Tax=Strigomonas culicis TaxID=28005 RepID=S9UIG5_9TRYP|nr:calpain-like cysteine peptidase [Strigomonas culicis]|eukprot:EPY28743.1 calpain-like cysteine peptidase [Strigomonas culicis]